MYIIHCMGKPLLNAQQISCKQNINISENSAEQTYVSVHT